MAAGSGLGDAGTCVGVGASDSLDGGVGEGFTVWIEGGELGSEEALPPAAWQPVASRMTVARSAPRRMRIP
jgi:hypothetical protein